NSSELKVSLAARQCQRLRPTKVSIRSRSSACSRLVSTERPHRNLTVRRNAQYSPRALMSSPRTSLTRVSQELLEQPTQLERRALATIAHDGRCNVARAIDLPIANRRAAQSGRAALAALSPRASDPALALARQQLPARTRAGTRRILASDETAAVESNDVETTILCGLVERAAHGDAIAVAVGGGEADPVGMRRRLPGVARRLIP